MPRTRTRTRIKVCCISSLEEMRAAVAAGADAIGLVSAMPSGPGPIEEERIARIAAATPPGVDTFLLTSLTRAGEIAEQHRRCRTSVIQLVDHLDPGELGRLGDLLCAVRRVQVIHVAGDVALDEAARAAREVEALLLDSGRPDAAVPELGGTGRVHDWTVSRAIVESSDRPVWLAGGLTPANVADAIRAVRPFGVDLCSGVRTGGRLDPEKLRAFVAAVEATRTPEGT